MDRFIQIANTTAIDKDVPWQIKVLPLGLVKSQKGSFLVDMESYNSIVQQFNERQLDIPIDYEHQTLNDVQAPAAGWIKKLELKMDGIYATVEWTPNAKQYLQNKEYRYLSPVINVRESDRKAMQLHSVALTNTPAIDGMTPVVNSTSADNPAQPLPPEGGADQDADSFLNELRELLQLPENVPVSEIRSMLLQLLQSRSSLKMEVQMHEFEAHKAKAEQLVHQAMKEGKVTPAQQGWAFKTALENYDGFCEWYKDAIPVVPMGEMLKDTTLELSRQAHRLNTDSLMGLTDEDIRKYGGNRQL